MDNNLGKYIPEYNGELRSHMVEMPEVISECSGIRIFGRVIKSIVFSTDVAIIRNVNADAIIAVYPFTPQPIITHSLMLASDIPVFCGVGGGITSGPRVAQLASDAEFQGALGVVVNSPTSNASLRLMRKVIDIPIIVTVVSEYEDVSMRIESGASIFNVSAAARTPFIVERIRSQMPDAAIIATGGPNDTTIRETIQAGANAISWTPPTSGTLFKELMETYRRFEHETQGGKPERR